MKLAPERLELLLTHQDDSGEIRAHIEAIEEEQDFHRDWTAFLAKQLAVVEEKLRLSSVENARLREALDFYADPDTYFAIGFFPDPPCGDFMDDFSTTEYIGEFQVKRPGKRARLALYGEESIPYTSLEEV